MTLKNLLNSSSSYLMSMLCKSSTNKYMIIVKKKVIDKIMKNMIKLFFFKNYKIKGLKYYFT